MGGVSPTKLKIEKLSESRVLFRLGKRVLQAGINCGQFYGVFRA